MTAPDARAWVKQSTRTAESSYSQSQSSQQYQHYGGSASASSTVSQSQQVGVALIKPFVLSSIRRSACSFVLMCSFFSSHMGKSMFVCL